MEGSDVADRRAAEASEAVITSSIPDGDGDGDGVQRNWSRERERGEGRRIGDGCDERWMIGGGRGEEMKEIGAIGTVRRHFFFTVLSSEYHIRRLLPVIRSPTGRKLLFAPCYIVY